MSMDGVGRVIRALRGHSKAPDFESRLYSSFFYFYFIFLAHSGFIFNSAHIVFLLIFCAQRFSFYYFLLFFIILVVIFVS